MMVCSVDDSLIIITGGMIIKEVKKKEKNRVRVRDG
jgi:hypothetical protein